MTEQHPIAVPSELLEQWRTAPEYATDHEMLTLVSMTTCRTQEIADKAAQWGADQELDACCEWLFLHRYGNPANVLRAARRPKPPSLKEQALETLRSMQIDPVILDGINVNKEVMDKYDIIRRALESLPE